jgi:hypothetical protein
MRVRRVFGPLLFFGALTSSAQLHAATGTSKESSVADALFDEGRALMERGELERACKAFRASVEVDEAPGAMMNWGVCEAKRGKLLDARSILRRSLGLLDEEDRRARFVEKALDQIEARIPTLLLQLSLPLPVGSEVALDGVHIEVSVKKREVELDPGFHRIDVTSPHHADRQYTLAIQEGEKRELTVLPGSKLETFAAQEDRRRRRVVHQVLGFSALGVGALGVSAGIVTGVMAEQEKRIVNSHCVGRACDEEGGAAASRGRDLVALNTAAWITAAASTTLGITFLITMPRAVGGDTRVSASIEDGAPFLKLSGTF